MKVYVCYEEASNVYNASYYQVVKVVSTEKIAQEWKESGHGKNYNNATRAYEEFEVDK